MAFVPPRFYIKWEDGNTNVYAVNYYGGHVIGLNSNAEYFDRVEFLDYATQHFTRTRGQFRRLAFKLQSNREITVQEHQQQGNVWVLFRMGRITAVW